MEGHDRSSTAAGGEVIMSLQHNCDVNDKQRFENEITITSAA